MTSIPPERRRILYDWNDTKQGYPQGCIHELFTQQAAKTPGDIALIGVDERLTFAELDLWSNQFAECLTELGVGPETFVGLCLERSILAVAALIGILKAGGAYVYLDPGYPPQRLREMARDAGLVLIVTNGELREKVFGVTTEFRFLDAISAEIARRRATHVFPRVSLDNAAYVIYTSGSTGKPKGAVEVHRSMTSRLISAPLPDIQSSDVCCLNSSLSSGISASRLMFPLVLGAPVVVMGDEDVKDVRRFVNLLESNQVTSVFMVPYLLRQVLRVHEKGGCSLASLRAVTITGDALTPDLIDSFRRRLPQTLLINVYGSTEIGTTATLGVIDSSSRSGSISIGRPVANTKVYVLDRGLNLVSAGEPGEICVAAPHLARGYLNRPDLTAERFVANPFGQLAGERMCRTGDLGRYLPDGEIEFLGREDHQVKIRGYRIQLGEIEAALLGHPSVSEAAVTARGSDDRRRLVAYLAGDGSVPPNVPEVKKFLADRLPGYMIPSEFAILKQLPRTDAGKIDRDALPEHTATKGPLSETPMERVLAGLWSELLKVAQAGVHDNFIELGGDSLAATQLLAAIREQFGVEIPPPLVFDATLREIAQRIQLASRPLVAAR